MVTTNRVHIVWIVTSGLLVVALYAAYVLATDPNFQYEGGAVNQTIIVTQGNTTVPIPGNGGNIAVQQGNVTVSLVGGNITRPVFPLYIVVWGFIGAATYVLKTFGTYLGKKTFKEEYVPYHIIRLFIGPSIAVAMYFIMITGGFFGLTIDTTKAPLGTRQYVFAAIAFMSGYFVRPIIDTISNIVEAIFKLRDSESSKSESKTEKNSS